VGKTTPGAQVVAAAPVVVEVAPAPTAQPATVGVAPVSPYPGTSVDSYGDIVYLVQPGDTTFSIALRFHTTVWQIVNWNYLYSSTYIQAGQLLIVGKI
jgi:LysM repeat protein